MQIMLINVKAKGESENKTIRKLIVTRMFKKSVETISVRDEEDIFIFS